MGIFENWPYTNYHDLNTNWLIGKVKDVDAAKQAAEDAAANAQTSETNASDSAIAAAASAAAAHDSELNAKASEDAVDGVAGSLIAQVNLMNARLDTIIPDGQQTVGNTELIDIRTAFTGEAYADAGSAVRGQAYDDYNLALYNQLGNLVPPYNGSDWTTIGGGVSVKRFGNVVYLNGVPNSQNTRMHFYGDTLFATNAPTYANHPDWYETPLDKFVVGHKYLIRITLQDGSAPDTDNVGGDNYIDMREHVNGMTSGILYDNSTWTCTFQPEMICFGIRAFHYNNAVYTVSIIDIDQIVTELGLTAEIQDIYDQLNPYNVPSYFQAMIAQNVYDINDIYGNLKNNGVADLVGFSFITDVHWSGNTKNSPALLKTIIDNTPIADIICGGDLIDGHAATKADAVNEIRSFNGMITGIQNSHFYTIFGNHDTNGNSNSDPTTIFTKDEEFNLLYSEFNELKNTHFIFEDSPIPDRSYPYRNDYCVERARYLVRYLCLDWNNPWNSYRTNWLYSILSKNDGYRYIVFYHGIYAGAALTPEHTQIMDVLAPYKNKIACVISGHAHVDGIVDYYGDGSVPVIVTDCDRIHDASEIGTTDEQCFDTFLIDFENNDIYIVRTGRGSNRTATFTM